MLLILIFLAEVAVGVVSYLLYMQISQTSLSTHIAGVFRERWGVDEDMTKVIDDIQVKVCYVCIRVQSFYSMPGV